MKAMGIFRAGALSLTLVATLLLGFLPRQAGAEGTWIALQNSPPEPIGTMLLLSDGTVMAQGNGATTLWYRLTPGINGGYTNGTWSSRTSMTYGRLYGASDVMPDGRVLIAGAEYGNGSTTAEVYDPVKDVFSGDFTPNYPWTIIPVPAGLITTNNTQDGNGVNSAGFIDSGSIVLSDGTVLISPVAPATPGGTVIFNPSANTFTSGPALVNSRNTDEAGLLKLPDDSVLVIDPDQTASERYIPSQNQWVNDGTLPVDLFDPFGGELGPGFMLPNGNAFFIGSAPYTCLYTPSGSSDPGTWQSGPPIPQLQGAPDAPAAMMVNGKILCALSPTPYVAGGVTNVFTAPTVFYEYDYSVPPVGVFNAIHAPDYGLVTTQLTEVTYNDRMLALPDGTILFTDGKTQLYAYQPDGLPLPAGKPAISSVTWNADGSLHVSGTLFNGISQGASFGDDAQMDSNYPLVRFIDGQGNVYYGRTYNWSSTGVQTGSRIVSTEVALPAQVLNFPGDYALEVVANGNASLPVGFSGPVWVDFTVQFDTFQDGSFGHPFYTLAAGLNAVATGGTIAIKSSNSHETPALTKAVTLISVNGPSIIGQ